MPHKELNKMLRAGAGSKLDPSLQAGAAGKIETRADLLAKGKEKRALKVCKGKLGSHKRAKAKREDMSGVLRSMRMKQ